VYGAIRQALLVCLLAAGCATVPVGPPPKVVGMVKTLDGARWPLGSLRGKPALLFVFTTWSTPALLDVRRLLDAQRLYGERLRIVAVALDEQPQAVAVFLDAFGPPFEVVLPDDRARFVGPNGPIGELTMVPTTALLTSDGEVFGKVEGGWPVGALEPAIERLLAADPATR
jgi:hypothetical protein